VKVAVIGSGIAGSLVALRLYRECEVTVYEADDHIGGHVHTHAVTVAGTTHQVDTGFIVYNDKTYPRFSALLRELRVATQPSEMSFSVRDERSGLEYNGTSWNGLFAQRRNLLRSSFWGMLADIARFNRESLRLLDQEQEAELPLGEYLQREGYGRAFVEHYIVPMGAAIWSTDRLSLQQFPARFFVRFLHNHGMLSVNGRPQWRVIQGGSARYVEALVMPFRSRLHLRRPVEYVRRLPSEVVVKPRGLPAAHFDAVFLACHSDQALQLLADADPLERQVLGAIPYQKNEAVLHTDARLLPQTPRARAAWNYHVLGGAERVAMTYNMNVLQSLRCPLPLLVTLNRTAAIDPGAVIKRLEYAHPLFTPASTHAQRRQRDLNGARRSYFCGAYWRFGFHEDAVVSAEAALQHFAEDLSSERLRRSA
jgi:predicted NAD/FAD-binding protein